MILANRKRDDLARLGRVIHGRDQLQRRAGIGQRDGQLDTLLEGLVEAIELPGITRLPDHASADSNPSTSWRELATGFSHKAYLPAANTC
jgi:hypothetical protein